MNYKLYLCYTATFQLKGFFHVSDYNEMEFFENYNFFVMYTILLV